MTDTGRFVVAPHWRTRWVVEDLGNDCKTVAGPYDHQADAEAEARRLNGTTPEEATP